MLDELKVFIQVVEAGNVTKAAAKLKLNQSTVSRKLQFLEHRLNINLIKRDINAFELTADGQMVYAEFYSLIHELNAELENIRVAKHGLHGSIRIMVAPELCPFIMTAKFYALCAEHPDLKVEFIQNYCQNSGRELPFDIGLSFVYPEHNYTVQNLSIRPTMSLLAAPKYIAEHGMPQTLAELDRHQTILHSFLNTKGLLNKWDVSNQAGHQETLEFRNYRIITNNTAHNLQLIRSGYGIGYIFNFLSEANESNLLNEGLIKIFPDYKFTQILNIFLVKSASVSSVKVDTFYNFILASIPGLAPK